MVIGFTGTRADKVNRERIAVLQDTVTSYLKEATLAVHGGATGMDYIFHMICWHHIIPTRIRYGTDTVKYTKYVLMGGGSRKAVEEINPKPYLQRNRDIVNDCDILIAVPIDKDVEEVRSGTWMTIRLARKAGKQIIII